ncbi:RNA-binding protein 1 [Chionoecetes opilio]|uniref:RNA-binding protein 1 n=1 Tax=Chionoecetes opilio TaxID=41210 RepID=A0A8J4YBS6_CHIOP|nr:RNA-binding protein 1 [Chionoecetes opilio]
MKMDCKVYVGNLGNNAAKHELESAFTKYGPLVNVWVARNPPGFAFVEFEDPRDAEDAVRALDGTRLCGVRVRVEMSSGRSRRDRFRSPPRRGGGNRRSRMIGCVLCQGWIEWPVPRVMMKVERRPSSTEEGYLKRDIFLNEEQRRRSKTRGYLCLRVDLRRCSSF